MGLLYAPSLCNLFNIHDEKIFNNFLQDATSTFVSFEKESGGSWLSHIFFTLSNPKICKDSKQGNATYIF